MQQDESRDGVRIERRGPVLWITLDRPERRNAIHAPAAARLGEAFELLASHDEHIDVSLVVRLDGNNAEQGRQILAAADLPKLEQVDTMDGAARRAAELAAD